MCVCVCELEIVMIHPGPFDNVAQQDVIVINITCQVMARRVNTFWDAISTSTSELLLFSCWLVLLARSDRGIVYNGKDMRRWCRERERELVLYTHQSTWCTCKVPPIGCILNFAEDLKFMLMNSFSTSKETGCGPGCSRKVHDVGPSRKGWAPQTS